MLTIPADIGQVRAEMVEKRPAEALTTVAPPKEEDFPRGGGGALTALERRQAREEGRTRAERELSEGSRPSKKRRGSSTVEVPSLPPCHSESSFWLEMGCRAGQDVVRQLVTPF